MPPVPPAPRWRTVAALAARGALATVFVTVVALSIVDRPLDVPSIVASHALPPIPERLPPASPPAGLHFHLVETARSAGTLEALIVGDGSWFRLRFPIHRAVLVRHPRGTFLFDLGLGRDVDRQFRINDPLHRFLLRYRGVWPLADQLAQAGIAASTIDFVVPSHMHWDHLSGLPDFPRLPVWVPDVERAWAQAGGAPYYLHSQFDGHAAWKPLVLPPRPYLGFTHSLDLYGDGSAVIVPLHGHTPGQVGLFLALPDGQRYLFSGDVTWTLDGVVRAADRSWLTRRLLRLDSDEHDNQAAIVQLHRLHRAHPQLRIVPAHDDSPAIDRLPTLGRDP